MRHLRFPLFLVLIFGLSGCYADPFRNPGDWSMTGAMRHDAAVQAADPSDLISGRADGMSNGVAASAAVDQALGGAAGNAKGLETPPPTISTINITGG